MVTVTSLWLPILLAAVLVFLASWLIHMLLPYHRTDVAKLPDTRVRRLDDGSGGIHGRLRMMLASVRRFSWEGILAERQPARVQPRDR